MSGTKPLAYPAEIIYTYDGSFEGFLCCVHESVYGRQIPMDILCEGAALPSFYDVSDIPVNLEKARRVYDSIPAKISNRALELVTTCFCSCMEKKELQILEFLLRAYREGGRLCFKLGDAAASPLLKAEKQLLNEAYLLRGFIRFEDVGGALAAEISPKNFVLPFIAGHFIQRYDNEQFMIFDKTHKAALVYQKGKAEILQIDQMTFPQISEIEAKYQALWKQFYKAVSIEGRNNPRCRMSHMPKRYWENMLEVKDLLPKSQGRGKNFRTSI